MKIDINKTYRTRDGREVKLFTTEAPFGDFQVVGAMKNDMGWTLNTWTADGGKMSRDGKYSPADLIEVVPKWRGKIMVHSSGPICRWAECIDERDWTKQGWIIIEVEEVTP